MPATTATPQAPPSSRALLAAIVSPWFLVLTGFVAANHLAFVVFGNCPSSFVLRRYFGVKDACER